MENVTQKWFHRDGSECTRSVTLTKRADTAEYTYQRKCSRCGGAGGSDRWKFTGFTCFECGGSGQGTFKTVKVFTAERLAKLTTAADKREVKRAAKLKAEGEKRAAEFATWSAEHIEQIAKIRSESGNDTFISDLLQRLDLHSTILSDKQLAAGCAAVDRIIERREAEAKRAYIGIVGERVTLQWTTDKIISFDNDEQRWSRWAARHLVIGHDEHGNHIKYVGSGHYPSEGETLTATATVAEHSEYRGQKQTTLQRPRFAESKEAQLAS